MTTAASFSENPKHSRPGAVSGKETLRIRLGRSCSIQIVTKSKEKKMSRLQMKNGIRF